MIGSEVNRLAEISKGQKLKSALSRRLEYEFLYIDTV
jgi:hypothetical protein